MQSGAAEGAAQDALQIGAMDAEIGRAEAPPVPAVLAHGVCGDPPAVLPAAEDQLGGLGGGDGN